MHRPRGGHIRRKMWWSLDPTERHYKDLRTFRKALRGWTLQRGAVSPREPREQNAPPGSVSAAASPGPFCPILAAVSPAHGGGTRKSSAGTTWCGTTCGQRHGVGAQEVQGRGKAGGSRGTGDTPVPGIAALRGSAIGLMASSPSPHVSIHRPRSRAAPRGRVVPTPSPGSWHGAGRPGWS